MPPATVPDPAHLTELRRASSTRVVDKWSSLSSYKRREHNRTHRALQCTHALGIHTWWLEYGSTLSLPAAAAAAALMSRLPGRTLPMCDHRPAISAQNIARLPTCTWECVRLCSQLDATRVAAWQLILPNGSTWSIYETSACQFCNLVLPALYYAFVPIAMPQGSELGYTLSLEGVHLGVTVVEIASVGVVVETCGRVILIACVSSGVSGRGPFSTPT